MNRCLNWLSRVTAFTLVVFSIMAAFGGDTVRAQEFDYERLAEKIRPYTVIVEMDLDLSFGFHSSEQKQKYLGTIVTRDGLVMFNGNDISGKSSVMTGFSVTVTPVRSEVRTLDGDTYEAEFLGVDDFTRIGFVKIVGNDNKKRFEPIKFKVDQDLKVGDWLTLYMLLPEFISPPLTADIGMVSSVVVTPELFPLTVGFNSMQTTSVLYDEDLNPVGVLGKLIDPTQADMSVYEDIDQFGMPLLGVISSSRLERVIADPPSAKGGERGWLGIRLQALTEELAEYWELDGKGGIIVNETVKGSPAEKAGLEVGDIIIEVNGIPVEVNREENISIFQRSISEMGPEASVEMRILRLYDGAVDTLTVLATLDKAPLRAKDAAEYENKMFEFTVRNLVFNDYFFLNQDQDSFKGVFVSEITEGGLASIGGLKYGDIIQRIAESDIETVDDIRTAFEAIEQNQPGEVIMFVWRDNQTMFLNIKTDWD